MCDLVLRLEMMKKGSETRTPPYQHELLKIDLHGDLVWNIEGDHSDAQ